MNTLLFGALFTLFAIVYYIVGMYAGRQVHTENDYFLAGRNLGFWSLTGTLLATQLGGGMILGTADHSYRLGLPGIFYSLGMSIGFLVLGLGFAGALRSFNIATTAELFEQQFGSVRLKKLASLLSILSLTGLFVGQVVASKAMMLGLGVESDLLFIGFWALLIGYTMYGGLPAVVATDLLQVVIIIGVFGGLFAWLLYGGTVDVSVLSMSTADSSAHAWVKEYWFAYIGMPLLFSLVEQDLAQRFFSARTQAVAVASSLAASVSVLAFSVIPVCFGIQAKLSGMAIPAGANPLIAFIAQQSNELVYALVMCALIAAIASTADSLLCAISSNVVQDFGEQGAASLWGARAVTVIVGVIGVIGAYVYTDILHVLTESYQLLVSSIFITVMVCFTSVPRVPMAATCSVLGGFSTYSILSLSGYVLPGGVPRALGALLVSLLGYGIGMMVSEKRYKS